MRSVTIRAATGDDAAACAALLVASIRALCHADHGGDPDLVARWCANKTPENLRRWIAAPATRLFVAARETRPLCVGAVDTGGEVLLNYVAPEARFQGVSRAMLARLEAELADVGVTEARLDSTLTALRFYRSAGWRDAGPPSEMFGLPSQPMTKALRSLTIYTASG